MSAGRDRLVLLGTAGGPLPSPLRAGIAQAVVAGGRVHLIDCGSGVTTQLRRAHLLKHLHAVFLTHLHSDHDCDYFNLFLLGWPVLQWNPAVHVYGPGPAGRLPEATGAEGHPVAVVNAQNPTPGLADLTRLQIEAHAYDINIRMRDSGRRDLTELMTAHEIALPHGVDTSAVIDVAEDDRVRVTAALVDHGPVFPSFAFRFDTDAGSIVLSGDTGPCPSLVALARGADILVHEVFDDSGGQQIDDDEGWEARQRREHLVAGHTPLSRVGAIAAAAEVRRLVLTHFIPGDDALPDEHWISGARATFDGEVIAGSDLAEVVL